MGTRLPGVVASADLPGRLVFPVIALSVQGEYYTKFQDAFTMAVTQRSRAERGAVYAAEDMTEVLYVDSAGVTWIQIEERPLIEVGWRGFWGRVLNLPVAVARTFERFSTQLQLEPLRQRLLMATAMPWSRATVENFDDIIRALRTAKTFAELIAALPK